MEDSTGYHRCSTEQLWHGDDGCYKEKTFDKGNPVVQFCTEPLTVTDEPTAKRFHCAGNSSRCLKYYENALGPETATCGCFETYHESHELLVFVFEGQRYSCHSMGEIVGLPVEEEGDVEYSVVCPNVTKRWYYEQLRDAEYSENNLPYEPRRPDEAKLAMPEPREL